MVFKNTESTGFRDALYTPAFLVFMLGKLIENPHIDIKFSTYKSIIRVDTLICTCTVRQDKICFQNWLSHAWKCDFFFHITLKSGYMCMRRKEVCADINSAG